MLKDPFDWFPSLLFGTILGYSFLLISLIDTLLPRLFNGERRARPTLVQDHRSFLLIQVAELLLLAVGLVLRYFNVGIVGEAVQVLGLVIMIAGFLFRTWIGGLLGLLLIGATTLYRIQVEEKVLFHQFGRECLSYGRRRLRLFPGI